MGDIMSATRELNSEISRKYSEKSSYEQSESSVNGKIDRLRIAKRIVAEEKELIGQLPNQMDIGIFGMIQDWRGEEERSLHRFTEDELKRNYVTYLAKIDNVLDCLCDEITRLENEARNIRGWIGSILSDINNLLNEKEKRKN